ncbi:MAG: hypothetical protein WD993_09235, partial [Thermoleophilaceae bacterium]
APETGGTRPTSGRRSLVLLLVAVVVLDIVAFFVIPPFPIGQPGVPVSGIGDLINANLEFPAPHVVWDRESDRVLPPAALARLASPTRPEQVVETAHQSGHFDPRSVRRDG